MRGAECSNSGVALYTVHRIVRHRHSGRTTIDGVDDAEEWRATLTAQEELGIGASSASNPTPNPNPNTLTP